MHVAVHGADFETSTDLAAFYHTVKVGLTGWLIFNLNNSLIDYTRSSNNMTSALRLLESLYFSLLSSVCNFNTFPILPSHLSMHFHYLNSLDNYILGSGPGSCHLAPRELELAPA